MVPPTAPTMIRTSCWVGNADPLTLLTSAVGLMVGTSLGAELEGRAVGWALGLRVGLQVGPREGAGLVAILGTALG